jgi:hypothetical protein
VSISACSFWVAIAPDAHPASEPAHPFAWYTAGDIERGLPMFEDSRVLAPVPFQSIRGMRDEAVTGDNMLARLAAVSAS